MMSIMPFVICMGLQMLPEKIVIKSYWDHYTGFELFAITVPITSVCIASDRKEAKLHRYALWNSILVK